MTITRGIRQAYDVQNFAHACILAIQEQLLVEKLGFTDPNTPAMRVKAPDKEQAAIIGTLGKVWKDAQEQIRVHKGKPLPGSLTHEKVKTTRQTRGLGASVLSLPTVSEIAEQLICEHGIARADHCALCDGAKREGTQA